MATTKQLTDSMDSVIVLLRQAWTIAEEVRTDPASSAMDKVIAKESAKRILKAGAAFDINVSRQMLEPEPDTSSLFDV